MATGRSNKSWGHTNGILMPPRYKAPPFTPLTCHCQHQNIIFWDNFCLLHIYCLQYIFTGGQNVSAVVQPLSLCRCSTVVACHYAERGPWRRNTICYMKGNYANHWLLHNRSLEEEREVGDETEWRKERSVQQKWQRRRRDGCGERRALTMGRGEKRDNEIEKRITRISVNLMTSQNILYSLKIHQLSPRCSKLHRPTPHTSSFQHHMLNTMLPSHEIITVKWSIFTP